MNDVEQRIIRVIGMSCDGCEKTIERELGKLPGVETVKADHRTGLVAVSYDPFQTRFRRIESKLGEIKYPPDKSLRSRLSRWWIRLTESTEIENKSAPQSTCCSDPFEREI